MLYKSATIAVSDFGVGNPKLTPLWRGDLPLNRQCVA